MAKVVSHTPAWLSRPSPGFHLFQAAPQSKSKASNGVGVGKKSDYTGACRTIAHRGTEIFVVVDNEIRWSDLVLLRDTDTDTDTAASGNPDGDDDQHKSYRTLKTPVAGQIQQIVVSPLGDYMAILTSHTVHLALLPDSSHLSSQDKTPLRIKTFQLGPTAHVLEQAPVVSALWHPLGHLGATLVTVTSDACVRLWELNRESRHSFDEPALALDLKKLANATDSHQDFSANKYGTNKAFSPDSVEMELASACFAGAGSPEEHAWSSMTLWLAMTEGDVYALCPLLPSKWEPTTSTIPSLSTAVVSKAAVIDHDPTASEDERRITHQQHKWLTEIDSQDPTTVSHSHSLTSFDVYNRPASPPAIPKLQGPFRLSPEPDFGEITDIFVIAPRIDDDALMQDDDDEDLFEREGLSVGVVCLATKTGKVHVCLDLDGVEAQWLPSKRTTFMRRFDTEDVYSELLLVETVDIPDSDIATSWPTFTRDPTSRYSFFLNASNALYNISLDPWISTLEDELANSTDSGAAFRLDVLLESEKTSVERILDRSLATQNVPKSSCIALLDSDLGHFILSSDGHQPQAVVLDLPLERSIYASYAPDDAPLALPAPEPRQSYQPAEAFFATSNLPTFLDTFTHTQSTSLKKADLKTQVRFSPATLQLLTDAHRLLSTETSRLGAAAADLFRRCERMKAELAEQIRRVDEVAKRIEAVTGDDDQGGAANEVKPRLVGKERIEERMSQSRSRSGELQNRVEALRRKMARLGGKELSAREEAWAEEVVALRDSLGRDAADDAAGGNADEEVGGGDDGTTLTNRLRVVAQLQRDLVSRAAEASRTLQPSSSSLRHDDDVDGQEQSLSLSSSSFDGLSLSSSRAVPAGFRKQKVQHVLALLERETALVDAVAERLGRLCMGGLG